MINAARTSLAWTSAAQTRWQPSMRDPVARKREVNRFNLPEDLGRRQYQFFGPDLGLACSPGMNLFGRHQTAEWCQAQIAQQGGHVKVTSPSYTASLNRPTEESRNQGFPCQSRLPDFDERLRTGLMVLTEADTLKGSDVVPGWSLRVAEICE
jgi:hypothetical protein